MSGPGGMARGRGGFMPRGGNRGQNKPAGQRNNQKRNTHKKNTI
jgi:hypothetical protein